MTYITQGFVPDYIPTMFDNFSSIEPFENDLVKDLVDPDLGHWTYGHNVLGETTVINDPKGNHVFATYDLLGRIKTKTDQEGVDTWTYDVGTKALGKLTHLHSWNNFDEAYNYDSLGRLSTTNTIIPGDMTTYTTLRTYDSAGRLEFLRYPPGNTGSFEIKHHYSADGYLWKITDKATSAVLWQILSKNAFGLTTTKEQGTIGTRFTYDPNRTQIKKIEFGWTQGGIIKTPFKTLGYSYDSLGNLSQRQNLTGPTVHIFEDMHYDALNRLTSTNSFTVPTVGGPSTFLESRAFQYDAIGNMTFNSDLSTFSPNLFYGPSTSNGGGPHAVVSACDQNACAAINYDANGNMVSGPDFLNDVGRTINWYSFNKPSSILESPRTASFTYNPLRQKVKQVETNASGTTTSVYVNKLFEKVTLPSGVVLNKHYLYGTSSSPEGMLTLRSSFPPNWKYFSYDHLNSMDMIYDPSVGVVENLSFDPLGLRRNANWTRATTPITSSTNHGYTNHEQLDGFGLVDMKGRMYDASINHFISADPYIINPLLSENANRYSYVYNNPTTYIDPTGYQVMPGNLLPEVVIEATRHTAAQVLVTVGGLEVARAYATSSAPVSTQLPSGDILTNTYNPKTQMFDESVMMKEVNVSSEKADDKPFISGLYKSSWRNIGYHVNNFNRTFDGAYNGTGLPPAGVRIAYSFLLPPVGMVSGGRTIWEGKDIYNRQANSVMEQWVLAPLSIVAPFTPAKVTETVPFVLIEDADRANTLYQEVGPQLLDKK